MAHTFKASDGKAGTSFTIMGWVNCYHYTGSWANIWHLSP